VSELQQWIAELSAADATARQQAAEKLYRRGCTLAESVVQSWRQDPELAGLLTGQPTVGVAVGYETFQRIREAWGKPPLARVPAEQDTEEFELHAGEAQLDILTTRTGHGPIARFLEKFGEGIQQVEYPVSNLGRATAILRAQGVDPVYPAAREGADDTRVNFFLVALPQGGKVLVELVEAAQRGSL
jgi:methylmalonyl-CoA/ethylmalonyl-CoA epimerase